MENSAAKSHWPFGSYPITAEESPEAKDTQLARAKLRLDWSFYRMPPCPLLNAAPSSSGCKERMGSCSHGNLGLTWPYYPLALDLKHIAHPLWVTFPPFIKHGLSQTVQGYCEDDMQQASQGLACQRCPMLSAFALHCKCSCK